MSFFRKYSDGKRHPADVYTLMVIMRSLGMGCHATVYSLFLRQIGITQDRIALLNSLFWLILILSELPTGVLADGKSRAWSVKAGFILMSISVVAYSLVHGFATALLAEAFIGVAMAFLSGAEQAWLTDALYHRQEGESLKQVYGRTTAWSAGALLLGGTLGDLLGRATDYRLSWLLSGIFMLIGTLVAFRWMGDEGEPKKRMTEGQALVASLKALRLDYGLLWAVLAAMSLGFVNPFNHYWSQFFDGRLEGAPLYLIWLPLYGSCAAAGFIVRRLKFVKGQETGSVILSLSASALGLLAIGWLPGVWMPLGMVMLHEIGRGAYFPLADVFVQRRVESGYRATYGSLHSFLGRMGNVAVLGGVWFFTRHIPDSESKMVSTWNVCGGLMLVSTLALFLIRPKVVTIQESATETASN